MNNTDIESLTFEEATWLYGALRKRLGKGAPPGRVQGNYEAWDWTKKNKDLAYENGMSYNWVCQLRRKLGKPKVCGGKHYPACLTWNWEKSDTEISRETGVGVMQVRGWRRNLNKPPVPREYRRFYGNTPGGAPQPVIDFDGVDWGQADVEIARAKNCSREYIRQKRAQLKLPKVHFYERRYRKFVEVFGSFKTLSLRDVAKEMPMGWETFHRYCDRAGITAISARPPKYPWDKMNFKLPNAALAEAWGINAAVVANRRGDFPALGKALFQYRRAAGVPAEFQAMFQEEVAKAQAATQTLTHTPSSDDPPQPAS